ncbi:DGQHR domain-containing protein [Spirosoma montaniterrae]|uniref:DGQHR domain-containing protein n=1 Tax=Spirosoma montaniterrae TaxID=1178516 RepID=A0A1P9X092_9BACT|nr:DGQHR domain-containing protein [Spirosoma montaniterrae]AQG81003.1 hypothetical protein AWR27_17755 [Spirosoma montaniterrae]
MLNKAKKIKKKSAKLSTDERLKKSKRKLLHKSIMNIFKSMGFEYVRTDGKHKVFGGQKGEFDSVFLFENILLFVEETITTNDSNHLKTKYFFYEKVTEHFAEAVAWLKSEGPDKFDKFYDYKPYQYKHFYIYISAGNVDSTLRQTFAKFKFIDSRNLKYFSRISSIIKRTAKYELYKFLGIDLTDIGGESGSTSFNANIETAIILPEYSSGFPDGMQVVTFAMKAEELMRCAYVFRKESWEGQSGFYQRLLEKSKVDKIREFLATNQQTFVNNIIVSLPDEVTFSQKTADSQKKLMDVFTATKIENAVINIPYKINSIGIIDGQHRVYSHYDGGDNDPLELTISKLRAKRHLLITGVCFKKGEFSEIEKRKFESQIFLQINSEQKKVKSSLIQHLKSLADPYSPTGIANNVLNGLNFRQPFLGLFLLSDFDNIGIKTSSIIKYGIQDLVELDPAKYNLYRYWIKDNEGSNVFKENNAYECYINYCLSNICLYFGVIKDLFKSDWDINNKTSRLLSVTPIIAFLLAYKEALELFDGPKEFEFYKERLKKLEVDFNQKPFPYTSSQWSQLVAKIRVECWDQN